MRKALQGLPWAGGSFQGPLDALGLVRLGRWAQVNPFCLSEKRHLKWIVSQSHGKRPMAETCLFTGEKGTVWAGDGM